MCNARHCRRLVMKPSFCETHAAIVIARSDSDEAIFLYTPRHCESCTEIVIASRETAKQSHFDSQTSMFAHKVVEFFSEKLSLHFATSMWRA